MLTTTTFSDQRSDGGQTGAMDLQIASVEMPFERYTQEQIASLTRMLNQVKEGLSTLSKGEIAEAAGVSLALVTAHAYGMGVDFKRGRRPGAGKPLKGDVKRRQRGVALSPEVWAKVETERRKDESVNDALERILRRVLN